MNQQIKERIDQLRRGEVPDGYKKTKVGIVPEEWQEARFKNMFSRLNRQNNEGNTNVLTISAQHGLISQEDFFNKNVASEDKSNYFLLRKGEYAYNKSYSNGYPFGALKQLEKYESGIVSPLYICFSATNENKCPDFFSQYFEAGKMNSEIQAFAQEGARNHGLLNISVEDFFNSNIVLPPLAEQKKIAEILAAQDKVIALNEKKIEELKKLKIVYLSKLFPKKGQRVPEWRFKGFTGDWEQRKLGEVVNVCSGRDYKHLTEGTIPVYGTSGYMLSVSEALSYDQDAIGIGRKGTIDKPYVLKAPFWTVDTLFYAVPEHPECLNFVYDIFQIIDWKKKDESTGVPSLSKEAINNTDIMIPQDEEQLVIGEFFARIDNLITLHQRKLDEEKQKKKALMQLLLTGIVRT